MRCWGLVTAVAFGLVSATSALEAAPFLPSTPNTQSTPAPIVPVVVFGQDARRLPEEFAVAHQLDPADVVRTHTASGLIQCGNAHGAGQLTLSDDVVTTAAHVFFDESGLPRAKVCNFIVTVNGRDIRTPIDLSSIIAGSNKPYDVAIPHDWAVARLTHSIPGVRPYGLSAPMSEDTPVTFVSRGHIDWGDAKKLSMQDCKLHQMIESGEEGTNEFAFDCDTGDGASGGAVMDREMSSIGGILVGWRSNKPFAAQPFSRTHYNFAVSLDGAFRQAVYSLAGKMISQK